MRSFHEKKLILILIISIILGALLYIVIRMNIKNEKPDNLYIKMNEINDNQSLIGLSSGEVFELLGEPEDEYSNFKNRKRYSYYAGKIIKGSFWGNNNVYEYYELRIHFNGDDKVEYTYMQLRN